MRQGQPLCWNPNVNMLTSGLLIRTRLRPTWSRSHHFPGAAREQPQSTAWRASLAHPQLLSAGVSWLKPEMVTVCPQTVFSLASSLSFFPNLLLPLLLTSTPLSLVSWPDKSSVPHVSLIPTLLASSDPGRSLLVKDSAVLREKVTQPVFCLPLMESPGELWWWELSRAELIFRLQFGMVKALHVCSIFIEMIDGWMTLIYSA